MPSGEQDCSPARYFLAVREAFDRAGPAAGGIIDYWYTIAGFTVRLRFAGPALVPAVAPALAHLATAPGPSADLTVCLWDSESTEIGLPRIPWQAQEQQARGEVPSFTDGRFYTAFQHWARMLHILDTESDLAIFWVPNAGIIPSFERAMPLRTILHWWMSTRDRHLVHAAVVGTADGGLLLAGKGGAGKSTTALACLSGGMAYVSDDYIALQMEPEPVAHSIYSTGKLTVESLGRFPHLMPAVSNPDRPEDEKAVLFLHEFYPDSMKACLPVRAVLVPRVTGRPETRIVRTSAGTALIALAPSSVLWLPHSGEQALRAMASLVGRVPSYILEAGTNIEILAGLLSDLLAGPQLRDGCRP